MTDIREFGYKTDQDHTLRRIPGKNCGREPRFPGLGVSRTALRSQNGLRGQPRIGPGRNRDHERAGELQGESPSNSFLSNPFSIPDLPSLGLIAPNASPMVLRKNLRQRESA